jgi:hypothetical protein
VLLISSSLYWMSSLLIRPMSGDYCINFIRMSWNILLCFVNLPFVSRKIFVLDNKLSITDDQTDGILERTDLPGCRYLLVWEKWPILQHDWVSLDARHE